MSVILVLVDGMRPDGMLQCGSEAVGRLLESSTYSLQARTVMPSVTLPCHMSLFHSVPPERHGILSNTYTPQVRPVSGLCEQLHAAGKKCAFFYTWEELRDLSRPDSLAFAMLRNQHQEADTDTKITRAFLSYYQEERPDFTFVYLGETDEVGGHSCGWMSEQYEKSVAKAMNCIDSIRENLFDGDVLIVLADHGGHDRSHGSDMPEDMTIPLIFCGGDYTKNRVLEQPVSILDVAPTITALLGAQPAREWEGSPILPC